MVTGGTLALSLTMGQALAESGSAVAITGSNREKAAAKAGKLAGKGHRVIGLTFDAADCAAPAPAN